MSALGLTLFKILVFPGFLFLTGYATLAEWFDRVWYARLQRRVGPPVYQPVADFFKLMAKEDLTPEKADRALFNLAPLFGFASVALAFLFVPIVSEGFASRFAFGFDLVAVLYLLTVPTAVLFLAGWSSANVFGVVGSTRVLTQLFAYEVPLFAALLSPAMIAGSWQITEIVRHFRAHPSHIPLNLIPFCVALVALQGKLERVPFDIPEAETEIVGGPLTEYSGKKLALLRLMVDMELVVGLALIGALFLGGFVSPLGPVFSLFHFFWKTLLVLYLMTLVRTVFARLRIEQMVDFCWTWLLPATFLQFLLLLLLKGRVF